MGVDASAVRAVLALDRWLVERASSNQTTTSVSLVDQESSLSTHPSASRPRPPYPAAVPAPPCRAGARPRGRRGRSASSPSRPGSVGDSNTYSSRGQHKHDV